MAARRFALMFIVVLLMTSMVGADTKMVRLSHTGKQIVFGRELPGRDQEVVTWLGAQRLRTDQGETSFIVRADQGKLHILNHAKKTFSTIDLPVDLSKILPKEMAQMMEMMRIGVTVTPSDETRTIRGWKCRRYDLLVNGPGMQQRSTVWSTTDVELDLDAFEKLNEQIMLANPGWAGVTTEMRKIKGLAVLTEGFMKFGQAELQTSDELVSVEEAEAPGGTYDTPEGYSQAPFDLQAMQAR